MAKYIAGKILNKSKNNDVQPSEAGGPSRISKLAVHPVFSCN